MSYTDSDLRKLQLVDLYTLLEVKRICELHQINYFLIGGTLLGAVRHKGFIPWDDDVDVGMLREDYDKFIKVCDSELRPEFYLQTKETDETYPNPFAKIRVRGTVRIEEGYNYSCQDAKGMDIDIFPYDNLPDNVLLQWIISNVLSVLWSMFRYRCGFFLPDQNKSILKKILFGGYRIIYHIISKKQLACFIDGWMQLYNKKPTEYVVNYGGAYSYHREMKKREVISNLIQLPFEENMFSCPLKYDEYLRSVYGDDYMCIPKEEDRVQHLVNRVEFGKYYDIDKADPSKLSEYRPQE